MFTMLALLIVSTFLSSLLLNYWFSRTASSFLPRDIPNNRSLHQEVTPRSGGIAISIVVYAILCVYAVISQSSLDSLFIPSLAFILVAFISLYDDYRSLSFLPKILVHSLASLLLLMHFGNFDLFSTDDVLMMSLYVSLTFIAVLWLMNSFNFMDGSDGLAAMMAIVGFGSFAIIGWWVGDSHFFTLALLIVVAVAGFLIFNFPKASIFLGDTGSVQLGLAVAFFSLWGLQMGYFEFHIPIILFSPFIADTTVTLAKRIIKGERFWQAHCTHFYQRLIQAGWSHRDLLLNEAVLMLFMAIYALCLFLWPVLNGITALLVVIVLYSVIIFYVTKKIPHKLATY